MEYESRIAGSDDVARTSPLPPNHDADEVVVVDGGASGPTNQRHETFAAADEDYDPPASSPNRQQPITSNQEHPAKRRTIHRIVRGWTTSSNDDTAGAVDHTEPSEPTTAPPPPLSSPDSGSSSNIIQLQFYCGTPSKSKTTSSSSALVERLLLETGWGCRRTTSPVVERNDMHQQQPIIVLGCEKYVSYDAEQTFHVQIHAIEECNNQNGQLLRSTCGSDVPKKIHRRILCVPLMSDEYYSPQISIMTGDPQQEPNADCILDAVQRNIRSWKASMDQLDSVDPDDPNPGHHDTLATPPPSVTLLVVSELPPLAPLANNRASNDDIRHVLQSNVVQAQLSSLCRELNMHAKYYTPVIEDKSHKERPPFVTSTTCTAIASNNVVPKRTTMEWWWEPPYTIDYCFESILQEFVQEGNAIVSSPTVVATSTGIKGPNEPQGSSSSSSSSNHAATIDTAVDDKDGTIDIGKKITHDDDDAVSNDRGIRPSMTIATTVPRRTGRSVKDTAVPKRTRTSVPMVAAAVRTTGSANKRMRH